MLDYTHLSGTGVALITPFNKDKSVDYDSLEKVIEHCIQGGVESLISMGTTGEAVTLSAQEQKKIIHFTVEKTKGRTQVIAGIGGNNSAEVIREITELDTSGITAILSSSPSYNKPSQEGIYQHYMALAEHTPLPIIIYNVPGRTASNILAETTLRLATQSTIFAGVKEASGDLVQATKIIKDKPKHFQVLSGDDPLALPLIGIGGDGVISVIANVFPKAFSNMIREARKGNYATAQKINLILSDLHKWLYIDGNPAGIKAAASIIGLCDNELRLPLVPMAHPNFIKLEMELKQILQELN